MYVDDANRTSFDRGQRVPYGTMDTTVLYCAQKEAVEGSISVIRERHTDELMPGAYPWIKSECSTATVQRMPVIIPGDGHKHVRNGVRGPERRMWIQLGLLIMLVGLVCSIVVVILATDLGRDSALYSLGTPVFHKVALPGMMPSLITSQGATATAITQDGYEYQGAGGKYSWVGVKRNFRLPDGNTTESTNPPMTTPVPESGTAAMQNSSNVANAGMSSDSGRIADDSFIDQFTPGQCTYWADYEYHRLTGYAVPWSGDAGNWASNASSYGWEVSSAPRVNSIIVLRPGVQGAGWAGHVAVVERVNPDGSVVTTNWNVLGWGIFSWKTYYPGQGVSFIWHS